LSILWTTEKHKVDRENEAALHKSASILLLWEWHCNQAAALEANAQPIGPFSQSVLLYTRSSIAIPYLE
jgi:hypothetical protein